MTSRSTGILLACLLPLFAGAQAGGQQVRSKADALFTEERFSEAMPLYSQLVSLDPKDRDLSYRFGTCILFSSGDKERAIGFLKYATEDPSITPKAWYYLGRAYHLNYRFNDALGAYQRFRGTGDKKALAELPVDALEKQCRNGLQLLSRIKDVEVRNKVEVDKADFFRFYDLRDIGGRIVVTPDELMTSQDRKRKARSLVYLPDGGGTIYFSSYGKDGRTGRDIYRTQLLPDGQFSTPEKLAGYINTDEDEDYPFMHPDGKHFFFSSKGHTSMGGYDVFKSVYDKGMDVFGIPENMDFAINTPDDDLFYLSDAEGEQACFASARDSDQGRIHVYRVSTAAVPVILAVIQGTYASELDADDRDARIVVEDALTREIVADVRTDVNGTYLLSLPRSGRYRFLVDAGPSGRTHSGMVEVPRSDKPRAYRQELSLVMHAAQEQLVIRNYFDEPMDGDLIAMALDEIRRRARLEVGGTVTAAPELAERTLAPTVDLLTQAGYPGNVTMEGAIGQLRTEGESKAELAEERRSQATKASALAVASVNEAELAANEAAEAIRRADAADTEVAKNEHMVRAAAQRQRARSAHMRARAAQQVAQQLESQAKAFDQLAAEQRTLAGTIQDAHTAKNDERTLAALREARAMQEAEARGGTVADAVVEARTEAGAREAEAAKALARAGSRSRDEDEVAGRLERLGRELRETGNKGKRQQLEADMAQVEVELNALREETAKSFARASKSEQDAAVARGGLALVEDLLKGATITAPDVSGTEAEVAVDERIGRAEAMIDALAIDQRYDAMIDVSPIMHEGIAFDWSQPVDQVLSLRYAELAENAIARGLDPVVDRSADELAWNDGTASRRGEDPGEPRDAGTARPDPGTSGGQGARANDRVSDKATSEGGVTPSERTAEVASTQRNANAATGEDRENDGASEAALASRQASEQVPTGDDSGRVDGAQDERHAELADDRSPTAGNGTKADAAAGTTRGAEDPEVNGSNVEPAGTDVAMEPAPQRGADRDEQENEHASAERANEETLSDPGTPARSADASGDKEAEALEEATDDRLAAAAGAVAPSERGQAGTDADRRATSDDGATGDGAADRPTPREIREAELPDTPDPLAEVRERLDSVEQQRFLKENALAEVRQLIGSERDRSARQTLESDASDLEQELKALAAEEARLQERMDAPLTAQARESDPAEQAKGKNGNGRKALEFDDDLKDEDLLPMLFATYEEDRDRLQRIADPEARAGGAHGLELMLADSIAAEMTRQLALLEADPDAAPTVLPRMDRLRQLKEQRLRLADEFLDTGAVAVRTEAPEATDPVASAPRSTSPPANGSSRAQRQQHQAVPERYVELDRSPGRVYASEVQHRSTKVAEAVAEQGRELARIEMLEAKLDTLNMQLEDTFGGKEYDRLKKQSDRTYDDLLIARTDLGQRMAFISRQEWKAASDSVRSMDKRLAPVGLSPSEPLVLLQQRLRADAVGAFDDAAKLRKRADRSEDILRRDSLYRRAYTIELAALRDMDQAVTVQNYMLTEDFQRGENLTYEAVAARMFGLQATDLAGAPEPSREDGNTLARQQERNAPPTEGDRPEQRIEDDGLRTAEGTIEAIPAEPAATTATDRALDGGVETVATETTTTDDALISERAAAEVRATETGGPGTDVATTSSEGAASADDRAPMPVEVQEARRTVAELSLQREQLTAEAEELQRASVDLADQAAAKREAAAGARRRDRNALESEARAIQLRSDSLLGAAMLRGAAAGDAAAKLGDAQQELALLERLHRYYYLSAQQQEMVLDESDLSRYFAARSLALDQREQAAGQREQAAADRELATLLQGRADALRAELARSGLRDEGLDVKAAELAERAVALQTKAEGHERRAAELARSAEVNESQAGIMLQGLDATRSSEIMAMEMATRRIEPLLAEAGALRAPVAATKEAATGTVATELADEPTGEDVAISERSTSTETTTAPASRTDAGTEITEEPIAKDLIVEAPTVEAPKVAEVVPAEEPTIAATESDRSRTYDAGDWSIRMPEELIEDVFVLAPVGTKRADAIVMDPPMPRGVVYKVQIGAFRNPIPTDLFSDLRPVMGESLGGGLTRYTAGLFTGQEQAEAAKRSVRERGYTDAFVVAYVDGRRVRLAEAREVAQARALGLAQAGEPTPSGTTGREPAPPRQDRGTVAGTPAEGRTSEAPATTITAPTTPAPVPADASDEEVLAAYPTSATEILDRFRPAPGAADYYREAGAAPATQVEAVRGLFFTVQVGVYSKPVALDKLFNITPLNSERTAGDKIRYTSGMFMDLEQAGKRRDQVVTLGVKDAFITAYLNGERVTLREARALLGRFGESILATPGR